MEITHFLKLMHQHSGIISRMLDMGKDEEVSDLVEELRQGYIALDVTAQEQVKKIYQDLDLFWTIIE